MGFFKDIKNYFYIRSCFKLIVEDKVMERKYSPKISMLGVLYIWHKVPANTPDDYVDELIVGYMLQMDEVLQVMNTDGLIKLDYSRRASDEQFYYYLIKLVPVFQRISFWYITKRIVLGIIIWYLINKFGLWQYKNIVINWLEDFWINIKP